MGEVEAVDQRLHVRERLDRHRTAEPRQQRGDGGRLQPDLAKMGDAQRAETLGKLAFAARQQRLMGEGRQARPQRAEHRSDERRGGKAWVRTGSARWSRYPLKKKEKERVGNK